MSRKSAFAALFLSISTARCAAPHAEGPRSAAQAVVFQDVTVVPMVGEAEIPHVNVTVEGDRITRVDGAPPPRGARVIDGRGKFLMPGMTDMHVHLPKAPAEIRRVGLLSLLAGVTTVRGMQGDPAHVAFRERARAEGVHAPELYLAGPPFAEAMTPEEARSRVRAQKAAAYDAVKVLGGFDAATYQAIIEEARAVGMPVVGHVPAEVGIERALAAHQRTIEHLMGYKDAALAGDAALADLAARTREARVWNCPTLDFVETVTQPDVATLEERAGLDLATPAERQAWRRRDAPAPGAHDVMTRLHREVLALARAGAPLVVGSDSPEPYILPGFGYTEELRQLAKAGLRPAEILRAATRSAAEALDRGPRDGTVQPGAVANLVLTSADPLGSVENIARPEVVMVRGQALRREEILAELAATR